MFQVTKHFTETALRAAQNLSLDATVGVPIPEMDGFFVIQKGRKPNGDSIVATIQDTDNGTEYDVYVLTDVHMH